MTSFPPWTEANNNNNRKKLTLSSHNKATAKLNTT